VPTMTWAGVSNHADEGFTDSLMSSRSDPPHAWTDRASLAFPFLQGRRARPPSPCAILHTTAWFLNEGGRRQSSTRASPRPQWRAVSLARAFAGVVSPYVLVPSKRAVPCSGAVAVSESGSTTLRRCRTLSNDEWSDDTPIFLHGNGTATP
jgi:hypothetical protein